MRITFISPPADLTGGARVIAIYAKALAQMGHNVQVVSPPFPQAHFPANLWSYFRGRGWRSTIKVRESHLEMSGVNNHVLERFRPVIDDDLPDADVVIATWWETAEWVSLLANKKGVKVYFIQHHEVFTHLPTDRSRATYSLPLHKIVVAEWLRTVMREQYGDCDVDLVPNSVDHSLFSTAPRGKQTNPTIGFIYAQAHFKGVDITLTALTALRLRLPRLRIIAFGSVRPNKSLPLPPWVEFHFSPQQSEIATLYAQCDAWITTSRSEGFNLPALEAMACRTPVVATRTGWPAEGVKSKHNGILTEIDDLNEIIDGTEWLLNQDDVSWHQLSDNAYATAQNTSWERSAKLFEDSLVRARTKSATAEMPPR